MQLPTNLLSDCVERGSIFHSDVFDDIDHGKFFVVIGVSNDYIAGFFFINSRINPIVMSKPAQLALQYQLKAKDYSFLRYDSFLSASNIMKMKRSDIATSIENGKTKYIDNLSQTDLDNVLDMVRKSPLYKPKEKKDFFY